MTVEELYSSIEGSYENAKKTLMMDKMITRFIAKFPGDLSYAKLAAAYEAGDPVGMFEGGHAMKGVCGNLGLTKLGQMAGEITEEFRPGNPRTLSDQELAGKMEAIRALYEKTVEYINAFTAQ